jgi:hypothetical protein
MDRFEIYDAVYPFHDCKDRRPWLVVTALGGDRFHCFPISGQDYDGRGFEILSDHPDFADTGLNRNCFVHDAKLFELASDDFRKLRGKLGGSLLKEFCDFSGIPPADP